jgi:hypothetical protein
LPGVKYGCFGSASFRPPAHLVANLSFRVGIIWMGLAQQRPNAPVELMRTLAAAAPTATHPAEGTPPITRTSLPDRAFPSIAEARHLSDGGHTPATSCSGSTFQAGSSKTLVGQGRP